MFNNALEITEYKKLMKAADEAPVIPPCMGSDPDSWFPEKGVEGEQRWRQAVQLCKQCPIQQQCLEYAMNTDQFYGVWGGTTPKDRQRMRSQRRKAA